MISTFLCPRTLDLFVNGGSSAFGGASLSAMRLMDMLQCAASPRELPPSALCKKGGPLPSGYSMPAGSGLNLYFSWRGALVCQVFIAADGAPVPEAPLLPAENTRRIVSHPGLILNEYFMMPYGISANRLAGAMQVPVSRILDIINERRGISADTAARLSLAIGSSPRFWTAMQSEYELSVIRMEKDLSSVESFVHPR